MKRNRSKTRNSRKKSSYSKAKNRGKAKRPASRTTAKGGTANFAKYQFIRFMFVGMINTLFGYGCFALFLYVGLHYSLALFWATVCGVFFNFKSTGALVFGSHDNRLIFRFIGSYLVIYFINVLGIKAFSYIAIAPYISGAILILPMAVLAFILNKRFVFNYG